MKSIWLTLILICAMQLPLLASGPVHTYSIVARDAETGEIGVAVQSHYFSVGPIVPWAEAGVGAVATQSFAEISYGPLGLELMKAGKDASQALQSLIASDAAADVRQVAMIDAGGKVAAHTGKKCIADAGHQTGSGYSVQANLMANDSVWPAMAKAYESSKGSLAERMLAALDAAQSAGGDIRGQQSAAIVVVSGNKTGAWWKDRLLDLRVEDNPEPLKELRRLVRIHEAYRHSDRGDAFIAEKNMSAALKEYEKAAELAPDNMELRFWYAVSLYTGGEEKRAMELFRQVFEKEKQWFDLIPRLPASDLLPAEAVEKIQTAMTRK